MWGHPVRSASVLMIGTFNVLNVNETTFAKQLFDSQTLLNEVCYGRRKEILSTEGIVLSLFVILGFSIDTSNRFMVDNIVIGLTI